MPDRARVAHCVRLRCNDQGCIVSIDPDVRMPLGLRVHSGERDAVVRLLMKRSAGTFLKASLSCVFDPALRRSAEVLADDIRERLFRIAQKPVSQRQVENILGITSRERIRWGKDGRLLLSGTSTIKRGAAEISLWTYPCNAIERLADNPATVRQWREEDAATTSIGLAAVIG